MKIQCYSASSFKTAYSAKFQIFSHTQCAVLEIDSSSIHYAKAIVLELLVLLKEFYANRSTCICHSRSCFYYIYNPFSISRDQYITIKV